MRSHITAALIACALLAAATPAGAEVVWGVVSAAPSEDPAFPGYWKYSMEVEWNTLDMGGYGMSHLALLLGLDFCGCACDPNLFALALVAGTGTGIGECNLSYRGEFLCRDAPHFPELGPALKFEHYELSCEPSGTGVASIQFYSSFPPDEPRTHAGVLGIKAGKREDTGDLTGTLPLCVCGSPVETVSWGTVKALYRQPQ